MHQANKPLPAVPHRGVQVSSTLTDEARTHLQRFILQALEEEGVATDRENWANAMKSGLLQLGANISRSGWLAGLKHMRRIAAKRREDEEARWRREKLESAKGKEQEDKLAKNKTLPRTPKGLQGPEETKRSSSEHSSSRHLLDSRLAALQQLRKLVETHASPPLPKPTAKHFLLTVDAYGVPPKRTSEDLEYDMIPYGVDCTFVANTYALSDEADTLDSILYGLAEWDGKNTVFGEHLDCSPCLSQLDCTTRRVPTTFRLSEARSGLEAFPMYGYMLRSSRS